VKCVSLLWAIAACAQQPSGELTEAPASPGAGFSFPYYLYVPKDLPRDRPVRLFVEPNNTGQTTDDFEAHRKGAKHLATGGASRWLADKLGTPLLVPVFPRPRSEWKIYTHYLDRDSMLIKDGPLKRIDLQLLAMIKDARRRLDERGIRVKPAMFMFGFSASAGFVSRFAALHPKHVRALAAGAINALPMLPLAAHEGVRLPFPLGIADFKELTGEDFDREAYARVSQFLYMGYLDRNDTFPFSDGWDDDEREVIAKALGKVMMPDRWERVQRILSTLKLPIQTVTYNGVAHSTRAEMWDDVTAFFRGNAGDEPARITPHEYPFVPYREIEEAHVTKLYTPADRKLPERSTFLIGIKEWMAGQDHQQLRSFVARAGFEFDLVAEGRPAIHINERASCGTTSSGDGKFQGFYVCLDSAALDRIAPGVPYSLRPRKTSDKYYWTVPPDVVFVKPPAK
jgi:pimeloyl-ACP methyl ester carboxylesterase